jgi:predicted ATPase/class 3 adenylate cyclase
LKMTTYERKSSVSDAQVSAPNCPTCGHVVPAGSKFCNLCGTPIPESPLPPASPLRQDMVLQSLRALMPSPLAHKVSTAAAGILGERREVTVLFLDIVDFTATATALDSEDVYLWTDWAMRLLAEVIYRYEGTIDKYTGDGLMALFGMPVAHENDPERAVRAALEMLTVLQPLQKQFAGKYGLEFQVRVGINTGIAIAGKIGSDLHVEYTVIGDTVNLADRLQSLATPNTIAVSFATYQRTQPLFRYETLPASLVKGKPHPIRAFHPLGLRATPGQIRGLPGLQGPMIGRQDALGRLQTALAQVRQHRHTKLVLITGDAGVGKSRLVDEFRRSVAHSDARFYQGLCLAYARSNPLWLLANMLRDMMAISETDPAEAQRETLQTYLDRLGLAGNDIAPYVINVLGLKQADEMVETRLRHFDSVVLQKLIHAALRQIFLTQARLAPTVLVFEDLHWIDPASRDFLEHLVQTVDDVPLLLIMVSRDVDQEAALQPLVAAAERHDQPPVDIRLRPLSQEEGRLLVDQLLKQTTDEAGVFKRRIAERAEGNPFYAEEIVRMLIDQGGLTRENGVWHVGPEADQLLKQVPGTLKGLVMARLDRLPDMPRRTLQKAAVLGPTFSVDLLQQISDTSATAIAAQMSTLEARQFLRALPFGLGQGYSFHHTLVQEVAYDTLLKRDRQQIHQQAAQAIEQGTFWLPQEKMEALAYHYAESPVPTKAIPHLIDAARSAARRCANETAIAHYRRALALIEGQSTDYDNLTLRIQLGLGQALKFVGQFSEASNLLGETLQRLLPLSLLKGSTALLPVLIHSLKELADIRVREGALETAVVHLQAGLDALGEESAQAYPHLWRMLIDRMAWVRFRQGNLEKAFALASSATLGLDPEQGDDPMTLASLYNTLGGIFWQWGNLSEAVNYVESSLELHQSTGYAWGMAIAYTNLGVLHYVQGKWPEAIGYFERAYALRHENGYLPEQALNLSNLGQLRIAMGDHTQAQKDLEAGLALSQRLGEEFGMVLALVGLAQLATLQGRYAEAIAHIEAVMDLPEIAGEHQLTHAHWLLALAQAGKGDLQAGLETAEQGLQMARTAGLTEMEADCHRVLGVLRAQAGDHLEAEALLREAVDLYLQLNAPYGQGQALFELGRLYQSLARIDEAAQAEWRARALAVLNEAIDEFEHLEAAFDLKMAQEVLQQLQAEAAVETLLHQEATRAAQVEVAPPPPSPALPEAGWHTVNVVWLSLRPPPNADEEAIFEIVAHVIPALTSIAEEYHGQIIRRQDGLTVVFGAPTAYEDDAERAVQTARRMVHHLRDSARQIDIPLTYGVAVNMGQVVAGQIGPHFHTEFMVRGEAVHTARLVAESAPPGQVWVTEPVRAKTERLFVFEPAPAPMPSHLADLSLAVLVGLRERPAPARGLPTLRARLIGREAPLQSMIGLSKNLNRRFGGLIWIEGEPGIGKSRLMEEFAASMAGSGALTWAGKCSPQRSSHAFSLFTHLVTQALNVQPADTPDQIRSKIVQAVRSWPRDAQMARSYLEMLLGLQPSDLESERLANLEPEQVRQQTFVALRRLFRSLANQQPLVFLLDDLHWIDPMSAEMLLFLITVVTSTPILFVCAQRRQGSDLPNDRLVRVQSLIPTQTLRVTLKRLSAIDGELLLSDLLPQTKLPPTLRHTILEQSEGNPYFIEEFVRMLIEHGYLEQHPDGWEVDASRDLESLPVPSSLETLVRSRVDALPPDLRQLLQEAAAIGAPFEIDLLGTISDLPDVKADVKRLESRLLVHPGPEPTRYQFNHPLIETVAYGMMLKARRRALHLKIAQALEERWTGAEADHAEELAYHFTQTDQGSKAVKYLVLAGERAIAQYANEEAISYLERAAQWLNTEPDSPDDMRWQIAASLGDAYQAVGKYADSTAILKAGLALTSTAQLPDDLRAGLYRRLGETARRQGEMDIARANFDTALSILGESTERQAQVEIARSLIGAAWTHFRQGHFDAARETCEACLETARTAGALNELAMAENLLGGIDYSQSEWMPALHHTTRAMVLHEQTGYTWGVASALGNLGILTVAAGHWSKARSFFERCLALQREIGNVRGQAIAHHNLGLLARDQGQLDVAEHQFRQSLQVTVPFEMSFQIVSSTLGLAQIHLLRGEIEDAQRTITATLAQAETIGVEDLLPEICKTQAEILLAKSEWEAAWEAVQRATSLAAEKGNRSLEATSWRVASEIELARDNPEAAREMLARAQTALADVTDELEAARIAAQAAKINIYQGEHAQAEADLRAAKEIFMRLGASLELKRVEDTLRQSSTQDDAAPQLSILF